MGKRARAMKKSKCKRCNGTGKVRPPKDTTYRHFGILIGTDKGWVSCPKCYGTGFKSK